MIVPEQLIANCRKAPERQEWLRSLPAILEELTSRWSLRVDAPFDHANVTCSWVAAVLRADGTPAVLKVGMPHMEGADEIRGLRFWNGDPTVQLLEADDDLGAMLLERCLPGHMLRSEPEEKQDLVIAALLKRIWRRSTSLNAKTYVQALVRAVKRLAPGNAQPSSVLAGRWHGARRIANLSGAREASTFRHTSCHRSSRGKCFAVPARALACDRPEAIHR
jgi:streptomycin 6-kinase